MAAGRNKRSGKKLTTIRLSPDRLTFHTSVLAEGDDRRNYTLLPDNASCEVSIIFSPKLEPEENIRRALAKCMEMTGWDNSPVRVMLDTRKTILIPEALFDAKQIPHYLKINNIDVPPHQCMVLSRLVVGNTSADVIMVYDKYAVDTIEAVFGDNVWFTSLLDVAADYAKIKHKKKDTGRDFTSLCLTTRNAYITIRSIPGGELRYCEILPCSSPADILYYMEEFAVKFDIRQTPVYVSGVGSEGVCKTLRNHFTRTKCE